MATRGPKKADLTSSHINTANLLANSTAKWSYFYVTNCLPLPQCHGRRDFRAAHERKRAKYVDLMAECREGGWSAKLYPMLEG